MRSTNLCFTLLTFAVAAAGCTTDNPLFNADAAAALSSVDLSAGHPIGGPELGAPKFDLSIAAQVDLAHIGGCGAPNQPCCPGDHCSGAGCCSGGVCIGEGHACTGNAICQNGQCAMCGGPGFACCENSACANGGCCTARKICAQNGGTCGNGCADGDCGSCQNGSCVGMKGPCGAAGGACCSTPNPLPNFCVAPGTVCANGVPGQCLACGAPTQPCCDNNSCPQGGCCLGGRCVGSGQSCGPTMCVNGSCGDGQCGGLGQMCCAIGNSAICSAPDTRCILGACVACGGHDQPCCIDWALQIPLHCAAPHQVSGINFQNGQFVGECVCK